jgi:hexokinase
MEEAFFDEIGLRSLTPLELKSMSHTYKDALLDGLSGKKSSLKMFRSCLEPVELSRLREGSEALILEVGGTNLYGARVRITNHKPAIINAYKTPIKKIVFTNAKEFFNTIITQLDPIIRGNAPEAISIVYSFAGKPIKTEIGVDVHSDETLTKEFVVPGISSEGIGVQFMEALREHHSDQAKNQPVVVLNDTVATLFSCGARIGGVDGTGFNLALQTPEGIVNSESGGFSGVPPYALNQTINKKSLDPGNYLAEKQISGAYISEQLKEIVRMLRRENIACSYDESITGEAMTEIMGYEGKEKGEVILKEVCVRLRDRSAQIVGCMIGTIILAFPDIYSHSSEEVPIEGSVFWSIPGYQDVVERTIRNITDKKIVFLNIPEAGRLGAAVAALSFLV